MHLNSGIYHEDSMKEWHKGMLRYPTITTKSEKAEKKVKCATCNDVFLNQRLLNEHKQKSARCQKTWKTNADRPYTCPNANCGRTIIGIQKYEKHLNYHCHDGNI